ncbi:MAG TPA: hypothetical protein VHP34_08670 [Alphaproteobacteria bacterium]|nr:hypothetical protein [Alphaproteobacteria bacterium]
MQKGGNSVAAFLQWALGWNALHFWRAKSAKAAAVLEPALFVLALVRVKSMDRSVRKDPHEIRMFFRLHPFCRIAGDNGQKTILAHRYEYIGGIYFMIAQAKVFFERPPCWAPCHPRCGIQTKLFRLCCNQAASKTFLC